MLVLRRARRDDSGQPYVGLLRGTQGALPLLELLPCQGLRVEYDATRFVGRRASSDEVQEGAVEAEQVRIRTTVIDVQGRRASGSQVLVDLPGVHRLDQDR